MPFFSIVAEHGYEIYRQIILGFIQGITEFLPISSTAHLIIIPSLFGWQEPSLTVIASLQLGSIVALFIYFWNDLKKVGNGFISLLKGESNNSSRLASLIFIGNLPIIFVGLLIKIYWPGYEDSHLRSAFFIAIVSIFMALLLAMAERVGSMNRSIENISIPNSFIIGCSQVLALIPGVSRSGITISASLLSSIDRSSAARFSFLLGIPAITLAGMVEIIDTFSDSSTESLTPLIFGIFASAVTSWFSIDFLIKFLKRNSTYIFVFYRLLFGFFLLIYTQYN